MMILQVGSSLPTSKALMPAGGERGPGAAGYGSSGSRRLGAGGGAPALRQNHHMRRKCPVIQPLSKSTDRKTMISRYIIAGSSSLTKDNKLESEKYDPGSGICGRHFLFDPQCAMLERTRSVVPPLPRDYHVHRPGNLHPFSLSKEFSHSQAGQPFTLRNPQTYELNPNAAVLFPSALFLNGRNFFSVESCRLNRPKVNYPTCNLQTVKDNQKSLPYPDPVVGASRSFINRISELSSLEAETARQEKLKILRKSRKPPS